MADVVTLAEVQAWLETTKLTLTAVDQELEATAKDTVFGSLMTVYDISAWTAAGNTPSLVRKIIAMLIASWQYARQYSEDAEEGSWYADELEKRAMALLTGLLNGTIELDGVTPVGGDVQHPDFFPTDRTGSDVIYDGMGNQIGTQGSEDVKFTMGATF